MQKSEPELLSLPIVGGESQASSALFSSSTISTPPPSPTGAQKHWSDGVELIAAVAAIGTSIAAVVTQQVILTAVATLPLSASVALNLSQRQRLLQRLQVEAHQHQASMTTLIQTQQEHQSQLGSLIASLSHVSDQVQTVQSQVGDLGKGTRDLHDYTRILGTEQKQIEEVVDCLRQIENYTHAIQSDPSHAKAYYNRGLTHQRLGDAEAAVVDYTEAIQVSDTYAKAYHNRGVARAAIGDRKGAVEDLRTAAKHFFEQGDIASYQRARDLAKRVHEVGDPASNSKDVPLELLFS